tara:strand:+ start:812 stop:976 length:165 start_codon:yes stop_codon:yes gene_type:complete
MAFYNKGLKKQTKKAQYQVRDIDPDTWRVFKAKLQLKGKTIKEAFHEFIERSIR